MIRRLKQLTNSLLLPHATILADSVLAEQGRFYYQPPHGERYDALLTNTRSPHTATAELFLFRFWLTLVIYKLCRPELLDEQYIERSIVPTGKSLGIEAFEQSAGTRLQDVFPDPLETVIDDCFQCYSAVFFNERSPADPLAINAVCDLASTRLQVTDNESVYRLRRVMRDQIVEISNLWAGESHRRRPKLFAPDRPVTAHIMAQEVSANISKGDARKIAHLVANNHVVFIDWSIKAPVDAVDHVDHLRLGETTYIPGDRLTQHELLRKITYVAKQHAQRHPHHLPVSWA